MIAILVILFLCFILSIGLTVSGCINVILGGEFFIGIIETILGILTVIVLMPWLAKKITEEKIEHYFEKKQTKKMLRCIKKQEGLTLEQKQHLDEIIDKFKKSYSIPSYKIELEEKDDIDIFSSKLGGIPYWDPKDEYPKGLYLLGQINFSEYKFDNELLPKKGMLQFFISGEDIYPEFNKKDKQTNWKVVYHEKINYKITKEQLEQLNIPKNIDIKNHQFPIDKEYIMKFIPDIDYTGLNHYKSNSMMKKILSKELTEPKDFSILNYFNEEEYDYLCSKLDASNSKLLGYPEFIQEDPREATSKYKKYGTLLFQLNSEGSIMFGDNGICSFFINKEDLKNKDFSKILYNNDCY